MGNESAKSVTKDSSELLLSIISNQIRPTYEDN